METKIREINRKHRNLRIKRDTYLNPARNKRSQMKQPQGNKSPARSPSITSISTSSKLLCLTRVQMKTVRSKAKCAGQEVKSYNKRLTKRNSSRKDLQKCLRVTLFGGYRRTASSRQGFKEKSKNKISDPQEVQVDNPSIQSPKRCAKQDREENLQRFHKLPP